MSSRKDVETEASKPEENEEEVMSYSPVDCGQPSLTGRVLEKIAAIAVRLAAPAKAATTPS